MQDYFRRFFVLRSSEVTFSFLIKKSILKSIEIEIAFFHSLGNPKGRTLDNFFYASHIRHNFPLQTDTYIDELLKIFLTLSTKTVQVHLIIGMTLVPLSVQIRMAGTVRKPRSILIFLNVLVYNFKEHL